MTASDERRARERRRALAVDCPHCGVAAGQRCMVRAGTRTWPLERLPAHWARLDNAPGTPALTRDELVAMARPPKPDTEETAA